MARYFVTGATGFVGAEVAKQLRTRGHRVTVLARAPAKASLLARLGCDGPPMMICVMNRGRPVK